MSYPHTQLFIHGQWRDAAAGETLAVFNPATGQEIGRVAHARQADLDLALDAVQKGFEVWRDKPPIERAKVMRAAAALMRERAGASLVGERLVVRVLAESGLALRRVIAPIIATLAGAGALPRLWYL